LQQFSPGQNELFVTTMWSLWKSRNLKLWQQQNEQSFQIVHRATHLLDVWRVAQVIRSRSEERTTTAKQAPISHEGETWKTPVADRDKCNIVASFSSSLIRVRLGMCIRNHAGESVRVKTD